jgi:hypothetical protein
MGKVTVTMEAMSFIVLLTVNLPVEVFCASLKMNASRLRKSAMDILIALIRAMKEIAVRTRLMLAAQ